jgi:hypothetical protein
MRAAKVLRKTLRWLSPRQRAALYTLASRFPAIAYGQFDNMRTLETNQTFRNSGRLKPKDQDDPQSFKTRSGKVGGFVDYLNEADTVYLTEKMHTELSSYYGYQDI